MSKNWHLILIHFFPRQFFEKNYSNLIGIGFGFGPQQLRLGLLDFSLVPPSLLLSSASPCSTRRPKSVPACVWPAQEIVRPPLLYAPPEVIAGVWAAASWTRYINAFKIFSPHFAWISKSFSPRFARISKVFFPRFARKSDLIIFEGGDGL